MSLVDVEREPRIVELRHQVRDFVEREAIPRESAAHVQNPAALDSALAELRPIAQEHGLYLPQLPSEHGGLGLSWVERAVVLEEAGRSYLGPGAMNCAAPDQPNMISLLRQGSEEQLRRYFVPLAAGEIRSCFAMTEPAPGAGSDPSMLQTRAERAPGGWKGDETRERTVQNAIFPLLDRDRAATQALFDIIKSQPGY